MQNNYLIEVPLEGGPKPFCLKTQVVVWKFYSCQKFKNNTKFVTIRRCTGVLSFEGAFLRGTLFGNKHKLEDPDASSPFQQALRSSLGGHEFLELIHFCKPHSDKGIPRILPLPFEFSSSSSIPPSNLPPPVVPPSPPSMAFFANVVDSPINLQGPLNDLPKNPKKFCPRFIYKETQKTKDHIKDFKEICNWK